MDYYHLFAAADDVAALTLVVGDQSAEDLRKKYLTPLAAGKDTVVGNKVWRKSDIQRIMIIRTSGTASDILSRMREEDVATMRREEGSLVMPMGFGTHDSDLQHAGVDVTADFVTHGQPLKSPWHQNQWVVGIGVTLIAAFIVWKLGWS